jgi:RES domain-containing protein
MKITTWRIVKAKHVDNAFDSEGARVAGGRWNRIGIPMIYTADSVALAVLEITVHLSKEDLLQKSYFLITVQFDSALVTSLDLAEVPDDWDSLPPSLSTQNIGTQWALSQKSVILKVPSTVVRQAFNYLINPVHPDFKKLSIGIPETVVFDPRIKK